MRRSHTQQPPNNLLHHAPRTQDGKLPLHYDAAKGAPFDVTKLLLDANLEAAAAADKARGSVCTCRTPHAAAAAPLCRSSP